MTEGISAGEAMMLGNGGCGGSWAWIVILLLAFNGGFGNRGYGDSNLARIQDVYASNDLQSIRGAINNLGNGIADATFALNNTIVNGHNTLGRDMMAGFGTVNGAIAQVRFDNAQNTTAITNAIHYEAEETRKLITQNKIEALQGKIAEQGQLLQSANLAISQRDQNTFIRNQNEVLINALRPAPIPAYQVQSPYVSTYNGCGCCY